MQDCVLLLDTNGNTDLIPNWTTAICELKLVIKKA